jgi:type III restriction enzyme
MPDVVIENPVLNSPYVEPTRHFRFSDNGITDEIVKGRRPSSYFIPIPRPKMKGKQLTLETQWTEDRLKENAMINRLRDHVGVWRAKGRPGVTATTRRLLDYWADPERERPLFFCQVEALETAIYISEVADRQGMGSARAEITEANESTNPDLFRIAFKMATGTGKTVVMGMLIAWQALNKLANPHDPRFSDAFLIVTPGITIKDRLRVLYPNDADNYYRERDLVPSDLVSRLGEAKIAITNYHAFLPHETIAAGKLTKTVLGNGATGTFAETPAQVVRRVCRSFGRKRNLVVINDEAHHCYRRRDSANGEKLSGDEKREAAQREEAARVWLSGLEAIQRERGIRTVYDLSATPFFLKGSGWPEGTLFPWTVSDFSLIDAIESGLVKVPRVPVADNAMTTDEPTYRNIWPHIRDALPKKGRATDAVTGEPKLPVELEGALRSLYQNYELSYDLWEADPNGKGAGSPPPVFIVVCNNTNVSKLVYDFIAGWEKTIDGYVRVQRGALDHFRNDDGNGGWLKRPNTILIDSAQLESGGALSDEFRKVAAHEIAEFKAALRARSPGADVDAVTDEDLLREVMNTVGKPGRLGGQVKCVVSVSMLTEGWDAQTVTHVLGVRAFGTQLLCEQVVGRALRRRNYAVNESGFFDPEYAEVYGVPFSFIPCSGSTAAPPEKKPLTRVRALEERIGCEITFPRLVGYRYEVPADRLRATFTEASKMALSTADLPTETEIEGIVGEKALHTLDDLRAVRMKTVIFELAKTVLTGYLRDPEGADRPWLFPQVLGITQRWLAECVHCKDNTFPQLLLLAAKRLDAAERIYQAIVEADREHAVLRPVPRPYDTIGSTRYVDFDTTRPVWPTRAEKCHVSHVVADTKSWEQKMARVLEEMDEVVRYVKNHGLGFSIPYTHEGEAHQYIPDFIAIVDDGREDVLNLIVEVSGEAKKEKAAKVATARTLWVPAVNNDGRWGRWGFVEIVDPWDAANAIRAYIAGNPIPQGRASTMAEWQA